MTVEELENEVRRWTKRVKTLERRLEVIVEVAEGRNKTCANCASPVVSRPKSPFDEISELSNPFLTPTQAAVDVQEEPNPFAAPLERPLEDDFLVVNGSPALGHGRDRELRPFVHGSSHDPLAEYPRAHSVHVEAVNKFADAMIAKLDRNNHKAHWAHAPDRYLLRRLREELKELEAAIRKDQRAEFQDLPRTEAEVREEAVDVANFAMMIFDIYSQRGQ